MFNLYGIHNYADMLEAMQKGLKFGYVTEYRDGTKQFETVLSADNEYIRWHHFGSSAHKATPRDLEFVITHIFKNDLDTFIRRFVWVW